MMRASFWVMIGYGASQALRLASSLILTRLLAPEAFGLMAIANTLVVVFELFCDTGIGPLVVTSNRSEDESFLNGIWFIQIVRGLFLWAVLAIAAYPVSVAYENPLLLPLLICIGSTAAIRGFSSMGVPLAERSMSRGKLVAMDLITQLVSTTVIAIWAYLSPSVWALAGGTIVAAILRLILGFLWLPSQRHSIRYDREAALQLWRYGRWIMGSTVLTVLIVHADRLIYAAFISESQLGVFSIALSMSTLLPSAIDQLASRVMFPAIAEVKRTQPGKVDRAVLWSRIPVVLGTWIGGVFLVSFGETFIRVLYPDQYHDAGWMLSLLAVSPMISIVYSSYGRCLLALGDSRSPMVAQLPRAILQPLLILLGLIIGPTLEIDALQAGILGMLVATWLASPLELWFVYRTGVRNPILDVAVHIATLIMCLVRWTIV